MIFAVVEDGIVVNMIVADEEYAQLIGAKPWHDQLEIGEEYTEPEEKPDPVEYISTPEKSIAAMMRSVFITQLPNMDEDTIIRCSGLASDWTPGNHKKNEIYNTRDGVHADGPEWEQTWECLQDYDNNTFPDIIPGNSSWYTFNRPLHGTSPNTARPWVAPMGAHDMYHSGEYAAWTDGLTYRCKSDTNFSPEDYPAAWEVING